VPLQVDKNMDATFLCASLKLLLEIWKAQPTRQFLILTPLDYSTPLSQLGITPEEAEKRDIRFLRLHAPRDGSGSSQSQGA
jgi:hypothetical protein